MAHVNQQVRDEVASRLTALAAFGSVTTNRSNPLDPGDLPAAIVQTFEDTVEDASKAWAANEPLERRTIPLAVVLVVDAEEADLDDTLDDLRSQVETTVASDGTLGGIAKEIDHTGAVLDVPEEPIGDAWLAFYALTWEIEVWTHKGSPGTPV